MVVTIQLSCNTWEIWKHRRHLLQVKTTETDRQILQRIRLVVRTDLHRLPVSRSQHKVCRDAFVVGEEYIIVRIGSKGFVTEYRLRIGEVHLHAVFFHRGCQSDIHTQLIVRII